LLLDDYRTPNDDANQPLGNATKVCRRFLRRPNLSVPIGYHHRNRHNRLHHRRASRASLRLW
jgi:hypothetical protein